MRKLFFTLLGVLALFSYVQAQPFFYGLTSDHRLSGWGTAGAIIKVNATSHTVTKVHSFTNTGLGPKGNLIQASDGRFYGLASGGGTHGKGVIFSYSPAMDSYALLYEFDGSDGAVPTGSLVQVSNGKLYGMTSEGGKYDAGVLFSFDPATNTYRTHMSFTGANGANPMGSLVQAANGLLYGMTSGGGTAGAGVLFSFAPSYGGYSQLLDFSTTIGAVPKGDLIQATDGKLYGLTSAGGNNGAGVLFSYDPVSRGYAKLYQFTTGTSGLTPHGRLLQAADGKLYGMTTAGGANGSGVLFSFAPASYTYTRLYSFSAATGENPNGSLVQTSDGTLFGMTTSSIFSFKPSSNSFSVILGFNGLNGGMSQGSLLLAGDGRLYGLASGGGTNGFGVLFSVIPSSGKYAKLFDFGYSNGTTPWSSLVMASDGRFYGMAESGGLYNKGVIFSFDPSGNRYSKLFDFNASSGRTPRGGLLQTADGKLYGMSWTGGNNDTGGIFSFDPATKVFTKLVHFAANESSNGSLIQAVDGKLYGMSLSSIFSYDPASRIFTRLGHPGGTAHGSLLQANDGKLYGMTQDGGTYNNGVLFSLEPASGTYTRLYNFKAAQNGPYGSLVQAKDGKLYGLVADGGSSTAGALFSFDPVTHTYEEPVDFYGWNGSLPQGSLVVGSNGLLYGMTGTGGASGHGVVFSFDPSTGRYEKLSDLNAATGGDPILGALVENGSCNVPPPTISAGGPLSFCNGESVVLTSSSATGNQWYRNGVLQGGATGNTFTAWYSGSYRVYVTNSCNSVPSDSVLVTVSAGPRKVPAPTIYNLYNVKDTTICSGNSVLLKTYSSAGFSYQWLKDGAFIDGARDSSCRAFTGGNYTVRIYSVCSGDSATSAGVQVRTIPFPDTPVVKAGGPLNFCAGDSVVLTSPAASGNQWYLNGGRINGATGQTFTARSSGSYTVQVTSSCTVMGSFPVSVTAGPGPLKVFSPYIWANGDTTFYSGENVLLKVSRHNGVIYKWFRNGAAVSAGGPSDTMFTATTGGTYAVRIYSTCSGDSATSRGLLVTVISKPVMGISANSSQPDYFQVLGAPSATSHIYVYGSHLYGNVTLAAPAGYQLSRDSAAWSSSLVLTPLLDSLPATRVLVRLNATAVGMYTGRIATSSAGATTIYSPVRGTAVASGTEANLPHSGLWVTNGTVNAIAREGNTVYLGGSFTYVGPAVAYGAALSSSSGAPNLSFAKPNGRVEVVVPDGSGGWFIGGNFTQVSGQTRNYLARINADGSLNSWNPGPDKPVLAMTISGARLYVGGRFTTIGGQGRNRLAVFYVATGDLITSWNPNANGDVSAIAVSGNRVYAGGSFTAIGGQARNYIAALNVITGLAVSWDPNANSSVGAIAVTGSTVYAAGNFSKIGNQSRNNLAALDGFTGFATSWNPNPVGSVRCLAVGGDKVYAGGDISYIGGQYRNRIAALDTATGKATAWNPNASGGGVYSLVINGNIVYAGGWFTSIGGQNRRYLAALDASTGLVTSWNPNPTYSVQAIAVSESTVYVGGYFSSVGGVDRNYLAALNATTGSATSWNPGSNSSVFSLAVSGGTVYAGGWFTSIGGQSRNRIAALNAITGAASSWNPNANSSVLSLAVSGSTVYAGGTFTSIGGQIRNRIAALNAATGAASSWNPNASDSINTIAVRSGTVYVGGGFTSIGGQIRSRIAALDSASGTATSWNPGANSAVHALSFAGNTVYAGGWFTAIGGQSRSKIAALDATTGTATSWNPAANADVYALTVNGSTVYAGGEFKTVGGQNRAYIAALDTASGNAMPWNPGGNGRVATLALYSNTLYAGGWFSSIGDEPRNSLAAFSVLPEPFLSVSTTPFTPFFQTLGTPSASQAVAVRGSNLAGPVTITAPSGYELSVGGGTWAISLTRTPVAGTLTDTLLVRLNEKVAGTYSGNISITTKGATLVTKAVSGTVQGQPSLTVYNSIRTAFGPTVAGAASASQQIAINGAYLTGNVTVTAPVGYELSSYRGGSWSRSRTYIPSGQNKVVTDTILVRLNAFAAGSYAGYINTASAGATTVITPVNGTCNFSFFTQTLGKPSPVQLFRGGDMNLTGPVTVTVSPGYELAEDTSAAGAWSRSITYSPSGGTKNFLPYVRLNAAVEAKYYGDLIMTIPGVDTLSFPLSGVALSAAVIMANASLGSFSQAVGTPSASQTFTVAGSSLMGSVTLRAPAGFQVSRNGSIWKDTLQLAPSGSTLASTPVMVRLFAAAPGVFADSIRLTSPGATTRYIIVAGTSSLQPVLNLGSFTNFKPFYQTVGVPSGTQQFVLFGNSLTGNVTVTAPAGYELKSYSGTTWNRSRTYAPVNYRVADTLLIRLNATAAGTYNGNLTLTTPGLPVIFYAAAGTAVNAPVLNVSTAALAAFSQTVGMPSASQSLTVSGSSLGSNVTLRAPAAYQLSQNGTVWSDTLRLNTNGGILAATMVYVRLNAPAAGTYSGNIAIASPGISALNKAVSGSAVQAPSVTVTSTLGSFLQTLGTPSAVQTFTVSGSALTSILTLTAPSGYQLSANSGLTWAGSAVLSPSGGAVAATTILVRLNATAAGTYAGSIVSATAGLTPVYTPVSGTVMAPPALTVDASGLKAFSQTVGTPSAAQVLSVTGTGLSGTVTLVAPIYYELSLNGSSWSRVVNLAPVSGRLATTLVSVRLHATSAGTYAGSITATATGVAGVSTAVIGVVVLPPALSVNSSALSAFSQSAGVPSPAQGFTVSGSHLIGTVAISAPEGFELSLNGTGWSRAISISPVNGAVTGLPVFVRLNAAVAGSYNGLVSIESAGALPVAAAVSGTVRGTPSLVVSTVSLAAFRQYAGTPSAVQVLTYRGSNIPESGVIVGAPYGFELSTDFGLSWGTTLLLRPVNGSLAPATVWIRLNAINPGTYNGAIAAFAKGGAGVYTAVNGIVSSALSFSAGPNPVYAGVRQITVNHPGFADMATLNVYGYNGWKLATYLVAPGTTSTRVAVQGLPAGTYTVELRHDKIRWSITILKF